MEYPHWLMVAGAVLVVVGFIGLAFHKNYADPVENNLKQAAPTDEPNPPRLDRRRSGGGGANRISSIQRPGYRTIRRSATSNFRPEFATCSWPRGSRRLARSARPPTKRC